MTIRINVAKSAGFCFGVKRALTIALDTAKKSSDVVMLGDVVHNEDVVREVLGSGIKKIKSLSKSSDKTLLIRAHGAASNTYRKAKSRGFAIVDATCPMVTEIHEIAKKCEANGYQVIVIGDKKHDEVLGIVGQLKKKALVIDGIKTIDPAQLKKYKKAAVVVQSTQNLQKTQKIVDKLSKHIKDLIFHNTICRPTQTKQEEIQKMPLKNDLMVIIGSKTSANTKRLYELSKSLNKKTFWIQSQQNLKLSWFKSVKSVGITAGASTPDKTTKSVVSQIKKLIKQVS